jgi:hypothetical protein
MENGYDADPRAQVFGISRNCETGVAAGTALSVITKSLHEIRKWLPDAGLWNLKLFSGHIGHFSPPPAMPTALAPAILASWPTSEPTGPLAAATTVVSPGLDLPIRVRRAQQIRWGRGRRLDRGLDLSAAPSRPRLSAAPLHNRFVASPGEKPRRTIGHEAASVGNDNSGAVGQSLLPAMAPVLPGRDHS